MSHPIVAFQNSQDIRKVYQFNQSTTENTAMLIDIDIDYGFSDDKDAQYEAVASQEEIYLEETEEEVRSILVSDNDSSKIQRLGATDFRGARQRSGRQELEMEKELTTRGGESLDDLDLAAEELIAGDSDDPPLSEETVAEMVGTAQFSRGRERERE